MPTRLRVPLHADGPALWPEYVPPAELEYWRAEVGTPVFLTMWQSEPGGLRGQIVREEFLRYYGELPPGVDYMAVDPAISEKTTADETAVAIGRLDAEGRLYIRWTWHGRIGVVPTMTLIAEAWDHYRPGVVGVEAVAYQTALIELLAERYPHLPLEPVSADRDKTSRFLWLGALYERGRIWHHPSMKGDALEYQLLRLPKPKHDDLADAVAYVAELAIGQSIDVGPKPRGFR